jgi:hypothetical protein
MKAKRVRAPRRRPRELIGIVLHRGISPGTGHPYAVIATLESRNRKTGNMVTVWIVRSDVNPIEDRAQARIDGVHSTCFRCPLFFAGCYVEVEYAPLNIWKAFDAGRYEEYDSEKHDKMLRSRTMRWGGYGDPVLVPIDKMERLCEIVVGWTGYTHQWDQPEYQCYRSLLMASVHSIAQRDRAWALGWRTFRDYDSLKAEPATRGECGCPGSDEQGNRLQCITCMICDGADRPVGHRQRASVVVVRHANAVATKKLRKNLRIGKVSFE